jgi:hypothetical protein
MELSLVDDDRLPHAGDLAILDLPRAVRGRHRLGSLRVHERHGLLVRLESPEPLFPVPDGVPVALTWGTGGGHSLASVVAAPAPRFLDVALVAPARQRRFRRYKTDLPALIELFRETGCPAWSCQLVDLSLGGARLTSVTRLDVGADAFLSISLPDAETVVVVVLVLDCLIPAGGEAYEVRVEFRQISDASRRALAGFLGESPD